MMKENFVKKKIKIFKWKICSTFYSNLWTGCSVRTNVNFVSIKNFAKSCNRHRATVVVSIITKCDMDVPICNQEPLFVTKNRKLMPIILQITRMARKIRFIGSWKIIFILTIQWIRNVPNPPCMLRKWQWTHRRLVSMGLSIWWRLERSSVVEKKRQQNIAHCSDRMNWPMPNFPFRKMPATRTASNVWLQVKEIDNFYY